MEFKDTELCRNSFIHDPWWGYYPTTIIISINWPIGFDGCQSCERSWPGACGILLLTAWVMTLPVMANIVWHCPPAHPELIATRVAWGGTFAPPYTLTRIDLLTWLEDMKLCMTEKVWAGVVWCSEVFKKEYWTIDNSHASVDSIIMIIMIWWQRGKFNIGWHWDLQYKDRRNVGLVFIFYLSLCCSAIVTMLSYYMMQLMYNAIIVLNKLWVSYHIDPFLNQSTS